MQAVSVCLYLVFVLVAHIYARPFTDEFEGVTSL